MKLYVFGVFVSVLTLVLSGTSGLRAFRGLLEGVSHPYMDSLGNLHAQFVHLYKETFQRDSLLMLIAVLEDRYGSVVVDKATLEQLKQKNLELEQQFAATPSLLEHLLPVEVIFTDPPIIKKGSKDGIREGAMVLSQGALVARVGLVGEHQATLIPLTSSLSKLKVKVQNKSMEDQEQEQQSTSDSAGLSNDATGLLGLDGVQPVLEYVRPDAQLHRGDVIVSFGDEEGIVSGIPIGTIDEVVSSPSDPFQRATVQWARTLEGKHTVFIYVPSLATQQHGEEQFE